MGWADKHIQMLREGYSFDVKGNDNSVCRCSPVRSMADIRPNNVVLCSQGRNQFLCIIEKIDIDSKEILINSKNGSQVMEFENIHGVLN